ncbi:MAG: hypothetical protein ACR2OR_09595 [Hyphomicrobiales bacterium]
MSRISIARAAGMICVVAFALAAAGCWEDRAHKPTIKKGIYPGEPQPQLSDEKLKTLQERTNIQRGGNI